MHLAYSALNLNNQSKNTTEKTVLVKYKAYQETCNKYTQEITAIQKYFPNWQPKFNY